MCEHGQATHPGPACMPSALSRNGPHALGNQVGEARWRELLGGTFGHKRLAAATPFNIVLELRK